MNEENVGVRHKIFAGFLATLGIGIWLFDRTWGHALLMCASLLMGWNEAFTPSPSAHLPLRDVYQGYRSGRFAPTSTTTKLTTIASIALLIAAILTSYY